jgi:hypothetical protein
MTMECLGFLNGHGENDHSGHDHNTIFIRKNETIISFLFTAL